MLSREQILAMDPKQLKRLVAEHIMGYSVYHYDKDYEANCYYMLVDGYGNYSDIERKTEEEAWDDAPNYPEDISAAWEVITKMYAEGCPVIIDNNDCKGHYYVMFCTDDVTTVQADASTAPEAICKAALLAVMGL